MCQLNEEVSSMSWITADVYSFREVWQTLYRWSLKQTRKKSSLWRHLSAKRVSPSSQHTRSQQLTGWERKSQHNHHNTLQWLGTSSGTVSVQLRVASLTFNASTEDVFEISDTCCCYCELWTGQEVPGQHGQPALQTSLQSPWRYPSGSSAWTTCSDSRDPQQTVSKHTEKTHNFRTQKRAAREHLRRGRVKKRATQLETRPAVGSGDPWLITVWCKHCPVITFTLQRPHSPERERCGWMELLARKDYQVWNGHNWLSLFSHTHTCTCTHTHTETLENPLQRLNGLAGDLGLWKCWFHRFFKESPLWKNENLQLGDVLELQTGSNKLVYI